MNIFIARQPIFDRNQQVVAYELLSRSSPDNFFSGLDGDKAASLVINDSLFVFGLDELAGGKLAYINVTRNVLLQGLITMIPSNLVGVEVLESVRVDDDVIAACKSLKKAGYKIALDDFVPTLEFESLVELADILKIDYQDTTLGQRVSICERFAGNDGPSLLAEKLETQEEYEEAKAAGFDYFQGFFFSVPEVIARKDIPGFKLSYLRFMQEINQPELNFNQLETIIKQDISLSYKLLRYINSAAFGWRDEVTSIKQALVKLGERPMKKWASLVAVTSMGEDKPPELIRTSLVRARFCELIVPKASIVNQELDLFLTGMLSVIDALIDRPIEEILNEIHVSDQVKNALLEGEGQLGQLLELVIAYEQASWDRVSQLSKMLSLREATIPEAYCQAVEWSDQVFRV